MFTEKPMIEAVAAFFDNVSVYVNTGKEGDALLPIAIFKMEELKTGGYRYVVDMPELPEEINRRINKKLERVREKKEDKKGRLPKKSELNEVSDKQEEYVPELAELTSTVTGKPVKVDVKKARALRKAGWSMEKTADEFQVSVEDLEELLA